MKKMAENRYPNSARLFRFCKEALEIRYAGNVKVIDQDVGAILGYDPADCSHWKKGKKNIRALNTIKNIADHLHIDERLLIDIASGRIGLDEAVFEYKGYGDFNLTGAHLEVLKKEFFKNPHKWQQKGALGSFEEIFSASRPSLLKIVKEIFMLGDFRECPIYVHEVFQLFNDIEIVSKDLEDRAMDVFSEEKDGRLHTTVYFKGQEMRPYVRFLATKALFTHLCRAKHELTKDFNDSPSEVIEVQGNLFAGLVLIPGTLLKNEVDYIDSSIDIIQQLSEKFWVSRALMNKRLNDFMLNRS